MIGVFASSVIVRLAIDLGSGKPLGDFVTNIIPQLTFENYAVRSLPIITADFGDKVLVFHCAARPLPIITTNSIENQKEFREVMERELPCYLHWLLHEWQIPEEIGRASCRERV